MTRPPARPRSAALAAASCGVALVALAGCSSSTSENGTATPSTPASSSAGSTVSPSGDVCADADRTRAALQALVGTDVLREGTQTLETRFDTFASDVQGLLASGRSELSAPAAAVKQAVADLRATLGTLAASPSTSDLASLKDDLAALKTSTEDLLSAVTTIC